MVNLGLPDNPRSFRDRVADNRFLSEPTWRERIDIILTNNFIINLLFNININPINIIRQKLHIKSDSSITKLSENMYYNSDLKSIMFTKFSKALKVCNSIQKSGVLNRVSMSKYALTYPEHGEVKFKTKVYLTLHYLKSPNRSGPLFYFMWLDHNPMSYYDDVGHSGYGRFLSKKSLIEIIRNML